MMSILTNIISFQLIIVGFIIDDLILLLKSLPGFIVIFSLLSFLEYSEAKNIYEDWAGIYSSWKRRHKRKAFLSATG